MKAKEIREKSREELNKELMDLKSELFKLRFQHATNQLDNPMRLREVRKSIARIKTVLRERELNDIKGVILEGGRLSVTKRFKKDKSGQGNKR